MLTVQASSPTVPLALLITQQCSATPANLVITSITKLNAFLALLTVYLARPPALVPSALRHSTLMPHRAHVRAALKPTAFLVEMELLALIALWDFSSTFPLVLVRFAARDVILALELEPV